jgi:tetratricopeptide (TPR) repeat protein
MFSLPFFVLLVAFGHAEEVEQLIARAKQAEQGGQLDAAAELYHRAAAVRPAGFNIQYGVGLHCVRLENWAEAEEHLAKALSLRPDFAPAHLNLGAVYSQNGQRKEARRAFTQAIRFDPLLSRGYYNLGVLELDDGRLDTAETLFQRAIVISPTHQASYVRLGNVYVRKREYTLARHVLGRALRLQPDDVKAFFNLGLAHEGLGEDEGLLRRA